MVLDTFTKYVELFPVVTTSGEQVAEVLYNRYILKHGIPEEILQDNGPPFSSLFHSQLTTLLGSKNLFTPAYHPQSNGTVERFMATLRRMIITYTEQSFIQQEWNKHLKIIQFVYNNTVHSKTNYTPFFLVHGRHPRTPLVTTEENKIFDHYKSPPQEFAIDLQERLNCAFDMIDKHLLKVEDENKENPYTVGQQVLLFNQSLTTKKKPRKLMFDWIGPYIITYVKSKSTVDLKCSTTSKIILNVHISRIKKLQQ